MTLPQQPGQPVKSSQASWSSFFFFLDSQFSPVVLPPPLFLGQLDCPRAPNVWEQTELCKAFFVVRLTPGSARLFSAPGTQNPVWEDFGSRVGTERRWDATWALNHDWGETFWSWSDYTTLATQASSSCRVGGEVADGAERHQRLVYLFSQDI